MGVGRNVIFWSIAGVMASLPIPFVIAGQRLVLYEKVPEQIQGRVFAVRNAIQFSTIPLGILLGGFLADYVFEPFMRKENGITAVLHTLVGTGSRRRTAVKRKRSKAPFRLAAAVLRRTHIHTFLKFLMEIVHVFVADFG